MFKIVRKTKKFGNPEIVTRVHSDARFNLFVDAENLAEVEAKHHAFDHDAEPPVKTVAGKWILMPSSDVFVIYEVVEV